VITDKVKMVMLGTFNGQTIKKDGLVDIKFKFVSDELLNSLQIFKFINTQINLAVKIDDEVLEIGTVMFGGYKSDREAVTEIKLTGEVNSLNLSELTTKGIGKMLKVRLQNV
jgi:hypothetical protein